MGVKSAEARGAVVEAINFRIRALEVSLAWLKSGFYESPNTRFEEDHNALLGAVKYRLAIALQRAEDEKERLNV